VKPRLIVTAGDPAGIGPEVASKALADPRVLAACDAHFVGSIFPAHKLGKPSLEGATAAVQALLQGIGYINAKKADGMVTSPVSKESFALAKFPYPGHTEWFAAQYAVKKIAMMMVAGSLRTILLTRHVSLQRVSATLTAQEIFDAAELGHAFLKQYVPKAKPIVLCGLNPHAGDQGILGDEEINLMAPAVAALVKKGIPIVGPIAADAAFRELVKGRYSLALAAYHDQGMIPLKVLAPEKMVNVTLGLPFVRTSPAHGTAFDIAGKDIADPTPMVEAILLAATMCAKR